MDEDYQRNSIGIEYTKQLMEDIMKKYKCEQCHNTGWYGDNGPGIGGNREYVRCECLTKCMKFKYGGMVEIVPSDEPGRYRISKGTRLVQAGLFLFDIEYIRENFTPGDCDALNLLDPDRTERLCQE